MDDRKKLAGLLAEAAYLPVETYLKEAEWLIAHGVTVRDVPDTKPDAKGGAVKRKSVKCIYEGSGVWAGRCKGTKDVEPCIGYGACLVYKPAGEQT